MRIRGLDAALDADPAPSGAFPALLVVDDDDMVRSVIVRALRRQGYEVLEAMNAEAALAVLGQYAPRVGLVLTDDRMPGMSGRELAGVVSRVYPTARIILMSGDALEGSPLPDHGSVRHLAKPFSASGLLDAVAEALA